MNILSNSEKRLTEAVFEAVAEATLKGTKPPATRRTWLLNLLDQYITRNPYNLTLADFELWLKERPDKPK